MLKTFNLNIHRTIKKETHQIEAYDKIYHIIKYKKFPGRSFWGDTSKVLIASDLCE
jgi:hypothetical protein